MGLANPKHLSPRGPARAAQVQVRTTPGGPLKTRSSLGLGVEQNRPPEAAEAQRGSRCSTRLRDLGGFGSITEPRGSRGGRPLGALSRQAWPGGPSAAMTALKTGAGLRAAVRCPALRPARACLECTQSQPVAPPRLYSSVDPLGFALSEASRLAGPGAGRPWGFVSISSSSA